MGSLQLVCGARPTLYRIPRRAALTVLFEVRRETCAALAGDRADPDRRLRIPDGILLL